jgi:hypothetical protein
VSAGAGRTDTASGEGLNNHAVAFVATLANPSTCCCSPLPPTKPLLAAAHESATVTRSLQQVAKKFEIVKTFVSAFLV